MNYLFYSAMNPNDFFLPILLRKKNISYIIFNVVNAVRLSNFHFIFIIN